MLPTTLLFCRYFPPIAETERKPTDCGIDRHHWQDQTNRMERPNQNLDRCSILNRTTNIEQAQRKNGHHKLADTRAEFEQVMRKQPRHRNSPVINRLRKCRALVSQFAVGTATTINRLQVNRSE